jgi:hypothetical protein
MLRRGTGQTFLGPPHLVFKTIPFAPRFLQEKHRRSRRQKPHTLSAWMKSTRGWLRYKITSALLRNEIYPVVMAGSGPNLM